MITGFLKTLFGDRQRKHVRRMRPLVDEMNALSDRIAAMTDAELAGSTAVFRRRLAEGETLDDILCEAFATVREACRRLCGRSWKVTGRDTQWNMVPYDVQLMGGIVLHEGRIAEMATGEGKTLVAVMPMYLNALPLDERWTALAEREWGSDPARWTFEPIEGMPVGRGAHLVTVNDYLALRDSQWMGPVYEFLGLTVGCIQQGMTPPERRAAYSCDITYGTNNEFGFDYLRDNMAVRLEDRVHRGFRYCIVDEVDSVLVDEARTPLIISGPVARTATQYKDYRGAVGRLVSKQSELIGGIVAEADRLWDAGEVHEAAELYLKARRGAPKHRRLQKSLQDPDRLRELQRTEAEKLRDKAFGKLDEELYFAIDERERSVNLSEMGRKLLSPEDPDFFLLRDVSEIIGEIDALTIPDDEKLKRRQEALEGQTRKAEALHAIDQLLRAFQMYEKDVEYVVDQGRVVIVDQFTGRLMPGRRFSDGLHEALEAKENVEVRSETQTLATITIQNYFRMYDKLSGMTGTAETEASEFESIYDLDVVVIPTNVPVVRRDHNDRVYKTKREKYAAVIDEVAALHSARQPVLVGTVSVDVSETLHRLLTARGIPHNVLNAKQHQSEAEIIALAGQPGAVTIATNMAGRGTDIKIDDSVRMVTGPDGTRIPGGLFVIGTERHEARRIDRQLRGRSGRQGDPGASRFYLSLEDDLFRLFASERMIDFLKKNGDKEGEVIEHPMLTKAIEKAQKRVEEYNFGIRKHLLEYDDVANKQREVVYARRLQALTGEGLTEEVREMVSATAGFVLEEHIPDGTEPEEWNLDRARLSLMELSGVSIGLEGLPSRTDDPAEARRIAVSRIMDFLRMKEERLGAPLMRELEKWSVLRSIDVRWREHLYEIDHLKEGIGLRAYGQRDPLVEFKKEAFGLFENLLDEIDKLAVKQVLSLWPQQAVPLRREGLPAGRAYQPGLARPSASPDAPGAGTRGGAEPQGAPGPVQTVRREVPKVGRNDPCPCGSGKKYKHCCGTGV
ncbi:MAG: preprotein translocase subunit SecA [Candidatus Fermentibacter sp.]|nr:preprotein translocase subunit SecA [Candidatus Fermentibacter sp.]